MILNKQKSKPIYPYKEWEIIEENFISENNFRNETIFSQGNGYIGFRGNFEEGCRINGIGNEGTYINGFFESELIKYGHITGNFTSEVSGC